MTNGFVGEFLILLGTFTKHKWFGVIAVSGVVLGAAYMLWMVKKVFFGEEKGVVLEHKENLDVNTRELCLMAPLIVLIFWMGLFPTHFFKWSDASTKFLVENYKNYQLSEHSSSLNSSIKIAGGNSGH
jgi:NADH-quinone oxidoreductase subunit M